jgi:hypothetical protein
MQMTAIIGTSLRIGARAISPEKNTMDEKRGEQS